jgi:AGZA family xanthine/uracil permease-like MFS transporter
VGLATLGVVLLTYFGRVRFKGASRAALVAVALGTLLAWLTGLAPHGPDPVRPAGAHAAGAGHRRARREPRPADLLTYAAVIMPMGLFNVLGSLQNIESAEAAGDRYPTGPSLAANGIGTIVGAVFGSASRRRSTSDTRAGRRWARARATR